MTLHVDHEWSEDGNCSISAHESTPSWRFSLWDIAGIAVSVVGGILSSFAQGANLMSREFAAAAEHSRFREEEERSRFEQEAARADMAGTLEGMFLFDDPGYQPIETEEDR